METIFISGKITGLSREEASNNFYNAEIKLKELGHECFNPIRIADRYGWNLDYAFYMSKCLAELPYCDTIYMLKNWRNSKGSKIEYMVARELGLNIMYEEQIPLKGYKPLDDAMTC